VVTEADVPRWPRLEGLPVGQLAVEELIVAVRGSVPVDALHEHLGLGMPGRQISRRATPWLIQRGEPGTNEVGGVLHPRRPQLGRQRLRLAGRTYVAQSRE